MTSTRAEPPQSFLEENLGQEEFNLLIDLISNENELVSDHPDTAAGYIFEPNAYNLDITSNLTDRGYLEKISEGKFIIATKSYKIVKS